MNADEFSEIDPYEEVAQQGQVDDDDDDLEEDPEEDPSEEHEPEDDDEDPEEDPNEEHDPAYDQAQLGRKAAMIHRKYDILEEDMPHRRRFALTGSPPGYQAQVRRQESENFYTQLLDAQTDRRDIRLEIDVVRGQRTAYETELQEVHQAYLSSEARNRELLARLEMLETHMSRMEWQRQSAEDLAVT
nr:hypothetical protein [Tanacetum cinerariifolium]